MVRVPIHFGFLPSVRAYGWRLCLTALVIAAVLLVGPPWARAQELPALSGAAYARATEAYTAFKKGNFSTAAARAREAIALKPDSAQLRLLLVDALIADDKLEEAGAVGSEALSRFGGNADLIERQNNIRERIAYKKRSEDYAFADAALKAFARQDYRTAAAEAARAVAADPTSRNYRLIFVNSLIAAENFEAASKQVADAIERIGADAELLNRQKFIAESIGAKPRAEAFAAAEAAYKAFDKKDYVTAANEARKAIALDPDNQSYRALLQTIESTARNPAQVMTRGQMLAERGYNRQRRGDFLAAAAEFTAALRAGLSPDQAYSVRLSLADVYLSAKSPQSALDALAPFRSSSKYAVAIRRAYAYQALKQPNEAIEQFGIASTHTRNAKEYATALLGSLSLLAQVGRKEEARQQFEQALENGKLQAASAADIANTALIVGNDRVALEYYGYMRSAGTLKGHALINAGYIATRLDQTRNGIFYFENAIDAYHAGALPLDSRQLFTVRRQVAEMSRTWGAYASATYSKTGAGPTGLFAPATGAGNTWQVGGELYWRPFGYQNGRVFDIFGRIFVTPYSQFGDQGQKTTQGLYGVRLKPFGEVNLIFELAQLVAIGGVARNDWLVRAGFSHGEGTDLRVDVPSWSTWQLYADYNHFLNSSQNTANADLRLGYSYRLDAIHRNLVLFPHVGAFASYDDKLGTPGAYALGAGATLRYWFREDKYTAPMSHIDFTMQYRARIAGDERAQGLFGQVFINY